MDAVKFFEESKRMCGSFNRCTDCPLVNFEDNFFPCKLDEYIPESKEINKVVSTVEKWSAEHPVKTRQSEFLKMFPYADLNTDGILSIAPCIVDKNFNRKTNGVEEYCIIKDCNKCRREYWLAEVE